GVPRAPRYPPPSPTRRSSDLRIQARLPPNSGEFGYEVLQHSWTRRFAPGGPRRLAAAVGVPQAEADVVAGFVAVRQVDLAAVVRSEEHTSELQSRFDLVCRLL